jgi:hypothetical protein
MKVWLGNILCFLACASWRLTLGVLGYRNILMNVQENPLTPFVFIQGSTHLNKILEIHPSSLIIFGN